MPPPDDGPAHAPHGPGPAPGSGCGCVPRELGHLIRCARVLLDLDDASSERARLHEPGAEEDGVFLDHRFQRRLSAAPRRGEVA